MPHIKTCSGKIHKVAIKCVPSLHYGNLTLKVKMKLNIIMHHLLVRVPHSKSVCMCTHVFASYSQLKASRRPSQSALSQPLRPSFPFSARAALCSQCVWKTRNSPCIYLDTQFPFTIIKGFFFYHVNILNGPSQVIFVETLEIIFQGLPDSLVAKLTHDYFKC